MPVNIDQWRAGIRRFHSCLVILKTKTQTNKQTNKKKFSDPVIIFKCLFPFLYNLFLSILILKAGDIELNHELNKNSHSYFSWCHWNVNSLVTGNCSKFVALKTHNSICKYDFICI